MVDKAYAKDKEPHQVPKYLLPSHTLCLKRFQEPCRLVNLPTNMPLIYYCWEHEIFQNLLASFNQSCLGKYWQLWYLCEWYQNCEHDIMLCTFEQTISEFNRPGNIKTYPHSHSFQAFSFYLCTIYQNLLFQHSP